VNNGQILKNISICF